MCELEYNVPFKIDDLFEIYGSDLYVFYPDTARVAKISTVINYSEDTHHEIYDFSYRIEKARSGFDRDFILVLSYAVVYTSDMEILDYEYIGDFETREVFNAYLLKMVSKRSKLINYELAVIERFLKAFKEREFFDGLYTGTNIYYKDFALILEKAKEKKQSYLLNKLNDKRMWKDFDDSFLFEDVGGHRGFNEGDRVEYMDYDGYGEDEEDY